MKKLKNRIGIDEEDILIPTPPRKATHFILIIEGNKGKQRACVAINDIDTLIGTSGELRFIYKKGVKVVEEFDPPYIWDGKKILGLSDHEGKEKQK
jgi:hypothetical protein